MNFSMFLAIVPAYNESKRIAQVVHDLHHHVDRVVVVDDCSSDTTAEKARAAGAIVLRHPVNRGQGAALETGHAYARRVGAAHVLHFDGDGQFDVADIAPALSHLQEQNADMLFGSRFLRENSSIPWLKRRMIHPVARRIDALFGSVPLKDAHNGFRILSAAALARVRIQQDRMAHASEIPMLVKQHGLRYVEFPVTVRYHEFGQGVGGGMKIVRDLLLGRFI